MAVRFADTMKAHTARMRPARAIRNIEAREAHPAMLEVSGDKTMDAGRAERQRAPLVEAL